MPTVRTPFGRPPPVRVLLPQLGLMLTSFSRPRAPGMHRSFLRATFCRTNTLGIGEQSRFGCGHQTSIVGGAVLIASTPSRPATPKPLCQSMDCASRPFLGQDSCETRFEMPHLREDPTGRKGAGFSPNISCFLQRPSPRQYDLGSPRLADDVAVTSRGRLANSRRSHTRLGKRKDQRDRDHTPAVATAWVSTTISQHPLRPLHLVSP